MCLLENDELDHKLVKTQVVIKGNLLLFKQ